MSSPHSTRSLSIALAGRPNVGKSTLLNALVNRHIAAVSSRSHTTRRVLRGIVTFAQTQLVFVDLPGVQRPRDQLTARMGDRVTYELAQAEHVLFLVDSDAGIGGGDEYIAQMLAQAKIPVTIAVNKFDCLARSRQVKALLAAAELSLPEAEVFPVSAKTGEGVQALHDYLVRQAVQSPWFYPPEMLTDVPRHLRIVEFIREQVLQRTFEEVPHAVEVLLEEDREVRRGFTYLAAEIWVETPSQKRILIGAGGEMVRAIGSAAREVLEAEFSEKIHLELRVRVKRDWRSRDQLLDQLHL